MRLPILACTLALAAAPALAQSALSGEMGEKGLGATEARLSALPAPTDEERFALGAVRFLGAIEQALQLRWKVGVSDALGAVPILRLPLDENPAPEPFRPEDIATLFRGVSDGLSRASEPLESIPDDSAFGLEVKLGDLWFDINANARRDPGEGVMELGGPTPPAVPEESGGVVRFDVADAAWLAAYCHVLAGVSDIILAYDPTEAIRTVTDSRARFAALGPANDDFLDVADGVDSLSVILRALNGTPDAARALQARDHLLAMVQQNRLFWERAERETDNQAEWLPNERQQAALGLELAPGTGAAWLDVLEQGEAVLRGDALVPFWRVAEGAGLNVGRMFTDPKPIDILGWIQGGDAVPYLENGRTIDLETWYRFEALATGDPLFLALLLN